MPMMGLSGCSGSKPTTEAPSEAPSKPSAASDPAATAELDETQREAKASALLKLANADLERGRQVSARRRAEEALAENPANADALAVLGASHWRAGAYASSTDAYERATTIDPKHFGATLGLARNLQATGQHRRALELSQVLLAEDNTQIDPWLTQLWSTYALLDADAAVSVVDKLFTLLPATDELLPLVQAYAAFVRPLAGKGPFCQVEGTQGSMDAGLDHAFAIKFTSAIAGEEFTRVVFVEAREEALIDPGLVAALKLPTVGELTPIGMDAPAAIVILPSLKFGELELRNVPAIVQSLESYEPGVGETPGVVLGRQALQAFGSYTFDFAANTMTVTREAPSAPAGVELPFLLLSMHVVQAPAVPIRIDGSEHEFFVYFGGFERSSLAVTAKNYLKSGHLPREIEAVDDAERGLKMVYVREVELGEAKLGGVGGLVLGATPPDATLDLFVRNTAFELGGYINTRMMERWSVTYALGLGKIYIRA